MRFLLILAAMLGVMLALIPNLIYLIVLGIGKLASFQVSYRPFAIVAGGLVLVLWGLLFYGYWWGRYRFQVKEVEYSSPALPAGFDGARAVHISDLHLDGWEGRRDELQKAVGIINGLHPEFIFFTGDLVSFSSEELNPFADILKGLEAPVYAVLGNHDYSPYDRRLTDEEREEMVRNLVRKERDILGWTVLLNESALIRRGGDTLAVAGVENQSCGVHDVVRRGRLDDALQGTEGLFRILLSHDPSHWRAEVLPRTDIPLTLSGHTHAMQTRILGFTPSKWLYPECDGLYTEEGRSLYVNIGLGGTLPFRIGARPEITLITFVRSNHQ